MINIKNILSRKNRILLAELVRTDFKLRYESSALGYVWSVLNPLLLFAVLYLVFAVVLKLGKNIEHFPVYLLTGIVLWRFFTETTNIGLKAIVARGSLIRKINFPKYIIVFSGTISSMINLGINLLVVLLFCLINGVDLSWSSLLILPFIIELYVFALGIAFFLSALNVRFRDIGYIWEVIIQAMFYAVPIMYPLSRIADESTLAAKVIVTNPVAQVIQDSRYFLVGDDALTAYKLFEGGPAIFIPYIIVLTTLLIGALYFKRKSSSFAENV